jgi:hypothetical protein
MIDSRITVDQQVAKGDDLTNARNALSDTWRAVRHDQCMHG